MDAEWVFWITAAFSGAFVGSFLNVIIFRGAALWGLGDGPIEARGDFVSPRSYCPHCRTTLRWFDLAPLVSFVVLGGKCRACAAPIPAAYPAVEALAAGGAVASVAMFGPTPEALLASVALFFLIAIAEIDRQTAYVPDALTVPFLAIGLVVNLDGRFAPLRDAVIGILAGYAVFASLGFLYRRVRGRDGLGEGDALLLAGIGAWTGWQALPAVVLIGAAATLSFVAGLRLSGRKIAMTDALPFGPGLCLGGAFALLAAQAPWNPWAG